MIIDCHCHAGQGDGFTGPWNTSAPLKDYLRRARVAGITRVNLVPAFHSDYRRTNQGIGALVRRHPGRFSGFAMVHAGRDAGQIRDLVKEAIEAWGACGIKIHGHDKGITREVCETAKEFHLPLLYDLVGNVATLELLASEYRDVDFVIPHMGSFADDWRAQLQLIDHLVRHPNVYADTSGVRRFDLLVSAIRRAGAKKLLFGSDGPWLHPGVELFKIHALGLLTEEESMVLGGTFLKLTRKRGSSHRIFSGADFAKAQAALPL